MMINNLGASFLMTPPTLNRANSTANQFPPTPTLLNSTPPSLSQPIIPNTGNSGSGSIMPNFGNMASNTGQMVNNAFQGVGNAFGSFGQLGAGALFSIVAPSISFLQNMNSQQPLQNTQSAGSLSRTSPQQIFQSVTSGANQAFQDLGNLLTQNAPAMMAYGGSMAGAGAICPYAGAGMAATGAAMLLTQNHGQSV